MFVLTLVKGCFELNCKSLASVGFPSVKLVNSLFGSKLLCDRHRITLLKAITLDLINIYLHLNTYLTFAGCIRLKEKECWFPLSNFEQSTLIVRLGP